MIQINRLWMNVSMRRVDNPQLGIEGMMRGVDYKQVKEEGQDRQTTPIYPTPTN